MPLKPSIASYSGAAHKRLRESLTGDLLTIIEQITLGSISAAEVNAGVVAELTEMHVLRVEQHAAILDTAVFLAEDISRISALASQLGRGLAEQLITVGAELSRCSPEIKSFLGGVVGVSQGLSKVFRDERLAVDWKNYSGRYAQTKVDFDQDCDAYRSLSPDWQIKSTLKGEHYTAVFIGPGGGNYQSAVNEIRSLPELRQHLARYLTDAYGRLLSGSVRDEALVQTAEECGLFHHGQPKPILVTEAIVQAYLPTIQRVSEASSQYYQEHLPQVVACLESTTCGVRGVPVKNMMMHFWRYCRRALAKELYDAGFLTDHVPTMGSITVFYENQIAELNRML